MASSLKLSSEWNLLLRTRCLSWGTCVSSAPCLSDGNITSELNSVDDSRYAICHGIWPRESDTCTRSRDSYLYILTSMFKHVLSAYCSHKQVYPLDAVYDNPEDVPEDVKTNKRYAGLSGFTIQEVADEIKADYGQVRS